VIYRLLLRIFILSRRTKDMKLTIGSTSFDITNCEKQRDLKIGFYLAIKVPRTSISGDELHDLLDGNKEVITLTKDDGTEESYEGFNSVELFDIKATEYFIKQACVSEAMAQISLLKSRATATEKLSATLEQSISKQNDVIGGCIVTINQHTDTINQQGELASSLMEANVLQTATLESLLLEVIPAVVSDAVTVAVAEALTNTKETTGENSEVIENSEEEVE
jgi:hypothetical protein